MKKKIAILIILVGIICLGFGCYKMFIDKPKNDDSVNDDKEETVTDKIDVGNIKSYSEYKNYKLKMSSAMISNGIDIEIISNNDVDVKNSIIHSELEAFGENEYYYFDYKNKLEYYSENGTDWKKHNNPSLVLPNFTNVIDKVKSQEGVTTTDDGKYTFTTFVIGSEKGYDNVPVTLSFTDDGFLDTAVYDLSDTDKGFEKYILTYKFSEINSIADMTIPQNIITGATVSTESTTIDFMS